MSFYDIFIFKHNRAVLSDVLTSVCEYTEIERNAVKSNSRKLKTASARHLFCSCAFAVCKNKSEIGRVINRNPATVSNSITKVKNVKQLIELKKNYLAWRK